MATEDRRGKSGLSENVRTCGQHHRGGVEVGKSRERPSPLKYILRYAFVDPDRRIEDAPIRVRFLLDKCHISGNIKMKAYSISAVVKELRVDRKTLWRWVKEKHIPAPTPGTVRRRLAKCWSESEMEAVRKFHAHTYGGKGMDRRKGSRAKQKGAK
jgi:predicted DNA-binding transcriptional regulator AlpA